MTPPPEQARRRIAFILRAAYAEGLLSERTLTHRLGVLFGSPLLDPAGLIDDLAPPGSADPWRTSLARRTRQITGSLRRLALREAAPAAVLALDWSGGCEQLLIGRHPACDVVLEHPTVSREHALLTFRDGRWVLRDLSSTNGTTVNRSSVVRCRLEPGDEVCFGGRERVVID